MKIKLNILTMLIIPLVSGSAALSVQAAENPAVPEGFKDLYQKEVKTIKFKDIQGRFHSLTFLAGYDSLQLQTPKDTAEFKKILIDNKIQSSVVDQMISEFQAGKTLSIECEGLLQSCSLQPQTYSFQYDYFTDSLYLFINPSFVEQDNSVGQDGVVYASSYKEEWGFLNHINFYGNKSKNADFNYSIYNETTLGLPYGNVESEFYYRDNESDDEFELDRLLYNYEFNRYRLIAGLNRDQLTINSTDFLSASSLNQELAVTFATSNNMQLGRSAATQKIFYFAPNDGVLTVTRNGRIVYQKNVPTGQGFVTNSELPTGRYTAVFEIKSGENVVSREIHTVYNTSNDTLPVGGYDFAVTGGVLEDTFTRFGFIDDFDDFDPNSDGIIDPNENDSHSRKDNDLDGDGFGRALVTYRPWAPVTFGAGVMAVKDDASYTLGMNAYLPYDSNFEIAGKYFDQGDTLYNVSLNVLGFGFYYEDFDLDEESILASYLYGDSSYRQFTISRGFGLPYGVQGYVNYNLYENTDSEYFDDFKTQTITTGFTVPAFLSSTLRFNLDYDFEAESNHSNEFRGQIVWSLPLDDLVSFESRLEGNEDDLEIFRNSLRADNLLRDFDGAYASMQVGHSYYPELDKDKSVADASTSLNYTGDMAAASAYGYIDTSGNYNTNFNLSSSQIISPNTFALSSQKANSYLVIDAGDQIEDREEDDVKGLLVLTKDETRVSNQYVHNKKQVVPLQDYAQYEAYLDTASVDLESEGDTSASTFTMPGTVQHIETKVVRVLSFISGFKDVLETPLANISCAGDGCVSEAEVTDGIYKITVQEGQPFKIFADDLVCFIPKVDSAQMFNFGENYCIPNIEPAEYVITYKQGEPVKITYVGGFDPRDYQEQIKDRLASLQLPQGVEIVEKDLGDLVYVYLTSSAKSELTAQQVSFVNAIQSYAVQQSLTDEAYYHNLVKR